MKITENIFGVVKNSRPDYLGFIFYKKSPRYVGEDFEMPELPESIRKVMVVVNERAEDIVLWCGKYGFNTVQLHGDEAPEEVKKIKEKGIEVIKAFRLSDEFDFEVLENYSGIVDYFLFDTMTKAYGGSGKTFNWSLLDHYKLDVPFFLSGGLNPDNIRDVEKLHHPQLAGLDVNSGFEISPGLKDVEKLSETFL